jgi:hypothetical protein
LFALFVGSLAVIPLVVTGCGRRSDPATKAAIQAAYDAQSAAYSRLDADGVLAICASDYEDENRGEITPRPHYEKTIREFVGVAASITARATVRDVLDSSTDAAEVLVDRHFEVTLQPSPKDGKSHLFISDETNRDKWIRSPGKGWQKRRSVVAAFHATMDGKSVDD